LFLQALPTADVARAAKINVGQLADVARAPPKHI